MKEGIIRFSQLSRIIKCAYINMFVIRDVNYSFIADKSQIINNPYV